MASGRGQRTAAAPVGGGGLPLGPCPPGPAAFAPGLRVDQPQVRCQNADRGAVRTPSPPRTQLGSWGHGAVGWHLRSRAQVPCKCAGGSRRVRGAVAPAGEQRPLGCGRDAGARRWLRPAERFPRPLHRPLSAAGPPVPFLGFSSHLAEPSGGKSARGKCAAAGKLRGKESLAALAGRGGGPAPPPDAPSRSGPCRDRPAMPGEQQIRASLSPEKI